MGKASERGTEKWGKREVKQYAREFYGITLRGFETPDAKWDKAIERAFKERGAKKEAWRTPKRKEYWLPRATARVMVEQDLRSLFSEYASEEWRESFKRAAEVDAQYELRNDSFIKSMEQAPGAPAPDGYGITIEVNETELLLSEISLMLRALLKASKKEFDIQSFREDYLNLKELESLASDFPEKDYIRQELEYRDRLKDESNYVKPHSSRP